MCLSGMEAPGLQKGVDWADLFDPKGSVSSVFSVMTLFWHKYTAFKHLSLWLLRFYCL